MRSAYENNYTWNNSFPSYTADVTYKNSDQTVRGKVQINANLKSEVFDIKDEEAKKVIANQLWEIAIHRIHRKFEDTHGKNTFTLGETDETGAVEILVGGKSTGNKYKLRNGEICLIHRHIGNLVITINTFSSYDTGEGSFPHRYDSVYHDPKTGEQKGSKNEFEDEYEKVGDYFILNRRIIKSETVNLSSTQEIIFSDIQLLVHPTS